MRGVYYSSLLMRIMSCLPVALLHNRQKERVRRFYRFFASFKTNGCLVFLFFYLIGISFFLRKMYV